MSVRSEWEMICPNCLDDSRIEVTIQTGALLTEDGTDMDEAQDGDHTWDETSAASCQNCGFEGKVMAFSIPLFLDDRKLLAAALLDNPLSDDGATRHDWDIAKLEAWLVKNGYRFGPITGHGIEANNDWVRDINEMILQAQSDRKLVGNQSNGNLRNMVLALQLHPHNNTKAEDYRLAAAKRILNGG